MKNSLAENVMAVEFARYESGFYYYRVTALGDGFQSQYNVCIDGAQEGRWGPGVPTNGKQRIGTCQKAIEQWCRKFPECLSADGQITQIDLERIRKVPGVLEITSFHR